MATYHNFCLSLDNVSEHLLQIYHQHFILKKEQRLAITSLLERRDVLAVLPTGFGKSLIYQYFVIAKQKCGSNASALVIFPLSSPSKTRLPKQKVLEYQRVVSRKKC